MFALQRSRDELPARHEEIENAEEEGLVCKFLAAPFEFYGDESGWVKAMKGIAMELTEPDAKGRRGVREVAGSEFTMDVDTVIIAIGQTPNPIIQSTTEGLQSDPRHGTICVNEVGKTSLTEFMQVETSQQEQQQSSALWEQANVQRKQCMNT